MEIKIAENIRMLRKEHKMTQEQLAEAFGVTIGAVSKWEAGLSIPDISIIMEMAEYFETSVDVLLGYEWQQGRLGQSIEKVKILRNEKRFDEAIAEADKALQKYPNCFELTHTCAVMFTIAGVELSNKKHFQRALMLWERALELIGQNKDVHISEWTIKNAIADVYLCMDKPDKAVELMKANNAGGINNNEIGYLLIMSKKQPDEGLPYLSNALIDCLSKLLRISTAYANAYMQKGKFGEAVSILKWMFSILDGLRVPGLISHLDKECVQIMTGLACLYAENGNYTLSEKYLKEAYDMAVAFDHAPDNGFSKMKFYSGTDQMTAFDNFGFTAVEGIRQTISKQNQLSDKLLEIWNRLV